jgi:hypothetical protein
VTTKCCFAFPVQAVMAFIMTLAWILPACAQMSPEAAAAELGGLADSISQNIQNPSLYVPKYNNDQTGNGDLYGQGELVPIDPGNTKVTGCANNPGDPNLYTRQDCEGVNFVSKNRTIRPNITVSTKDPVIAGNRVITSDPRATLEKYKWMVPVNADGSFGTLPANACPATTVNTPPVYEDRRCTFYKGSENFLCKAPLKVTVNPQFNYQCQDTLGINSTETCSKILNVQCNGGGWSPTCSTQGVVPQTFDADMQTNFNHIGDGVYELVFGTVAQDYWTGNQNSGGWFDKTLSVKILGLNRLDQFTLTTVGYDEWTWIKVNGHTVFIGPKPKAIDRLEHGICHFGSTQIPCVQYGPNANHVAFAKDGESRIESTNVDLKPYLVEGVNQIWTRTVTAMTGEMFLKIRTRMGCPVSCTENWDNQCSNLEQRAN